MAQTPRVPVTIPIPRVPVQTPMFEEDMDGAKLTRNLTRTWIIFFEKLLRASNRVEDQQSTTGGARGPYIRTLLVKDSTVGNDIADRVPIWVKGTAARVIGVLRKTITSDLVVRVKLNGVALITLTIPHATVVGTAVTSTTFVSTALADLQVLSWDITASDGTKDANGIASVTLQFS